ncbi:MAG TPA: Crp/Fnr family transcriptional regulator [Blastocatellia bacterium]|nr:Crp/Fnr family transcriptional regulator [Blastocatellia bacterium]
MAFAAPPRPRRVDLYANAVVHRREREDHTLDRHTRAHRVDLLFGLSQDEMSRVMACARSLRKTRGEFIYMSGDRADSVYVLKQGRVKLSVLAESGKEIAIDIIEPGEIFGEFALVDESLRSNMTQALDDVTMLVFDKGDFARLLDQTKLAMNYIRLVGDRRRRMEKKLSDIMSKDVSARVCELLHDLSSDASGTSGIEAAAREHLIPLTHYDVASLIGAARQTTTSVLNELERGGSIELGRGWIRVKCLKSLRECAGLIPLAGLQAFFHLCQLADIPLM